MPPTLRRLLASLCLVPPAIFAATPPSLPTPAELTQPRELLETAFALPSDQPRIAVVQQGNSGHVNFGLSYEDTPLRIGTKNYAQGIGVHAPSNLLVQLPQPAARFRAEVGYDRNRRTEEAVGSRLIFSVEADGKELWSSAPLGRDDPAVKVDVPIAGRTAFNLKVRCEGQDNRHAHGDWGDARLEQADGRTVPLDEIANHSYLIQQLPLSFTLGGESSRTFLSQWKREVTSIAKFDRVEHTLRWRKPDGSFEVRCDLVEFPGYPAVEWRLHFKNTGPANSPILEQVLPLDATVSRHRRLSKNSDGEIFASVLAANGSANTDTDFAPFVSPVRRGISVTLGSTNGRSSDPQFPFWNLDYGGYGIVTALGWSGDWRADIKRLSSMHTGMQAGMANLRLYLQPGEEISSPSVCLVFWEGGEPLRGSNHLRRFLRERIAPTWADGRPPAVAAMSGGSSALETVSERNQLDYIRKIAGTGAQVYWLDAGWYQGPEGGHWSKGRGNWFPDRVKFPRGLRPLGDEAHRNGLKFLLWYDPEIVEPGTALAQEHPEWLLKRDDDGYALFNLGDPAACAYLTDLIAKELRDWDVDIYRNDFNLDPREFWRRSDPPDRTGITELRYIEGLYKFWDGLRAAKPGLLIDNCASGGRRIDYETTKRSVALWRSDYECELYPNLYEASQNQLHGLSYFLPYHGTGQGMTFDRYKDRSLASACTVLSLGAPTADGLADVPFDRVKKVWDDVLAYTPLLAHDFYPLTDYSGTDKSWMALQYDRPETGEGCLIVFRRRGSPYLASEFALRAIDEKALYQVTILNTGEQRTDRGEELTQLLVRLEPGASAVILYKKR